MDWRNRSGLLYSHTSFSFEDTTNVLWSEISFSSTAWKLSVFGIFLVRIFPYVDCIRRDTVYLRIQSECGKIRTRKTPDMDIFYAVHFFNLLTEQKDHRACWDKKKKKKKDIIEGIVKTYIFALPLLAILIFKAILDLRTYKLSSHENLLEMN